MASRPQGNPPNGNRSRSASRLTHQPATATGQPGSRSSSRCAMASTARMTADPSASAVHANHQTLITQDSSGKKKATPNTSPHTNDARRFRPARATVSSATPSRGQRPDPHRRERSGQQQSARQRGQERPAQPQPRLAARVPPALARGGGRLERRSHLGA